MSLVLKWKWDGTIEGVGRIEVREIYDNDCLKSDFVVFEKRPIVTTKDG